MRPSSRVRLTPWPSEGSAHSPDPGTPKTCGLTCNSHLGFSQKTCSAELTCNLKTNSPAPVRSLRGTTLNTKTITVLSGVRGV
jgi:hypothetical protein